MCHEDHLPGRLACQAHREMEDRWTYYNQVGGYRLKQRLRAEGQTFEVCPNSVLRFGVPEIVVQCPSPGVRLQKVWHPKYRGKVGYNRAPLPCRLVGVEREHGLPATEYARVFLGLLKVVSTWPQTSLGNFFTPPPDFTICSVGH